jgi:AFG3 family protein
VRALIDSAYERTKQLLTDKRDQVYKLAEALLDREVLFQSDVEALIGKRPYEEKKISDVIDHSLEKKANENGIPAPSTVNPEPTEDVKTIS